MHGDDVVAPSRLARLREFAGPHPTDAFLRRALVRAAGNLDRAASMVLADPAYANGPAHPDTFAGPDVSRERPQHHSALPPTAARVATGAPSSPRSRSTAGPAAANGGGNGSVKAVQLDRPQPDRDSIRKAAWRTFYKAHYNEALRRFSPVDKEAITAFITDLWKDLGDQRQVFYDAARNELLRSNGQANFNKGSVQSALDRPGNKLANEAATTVFSSKEGGAVSYSNEAGGALAVASAASKDEVRAVAVANDEGGAVENAEQKHSPCADENQQAGNRTLKEEYGFGSPRFSPVTPNAPRRVAEPDQAVNDVPNPLRPETSRACPNPEVSSDEFPNSKVSNLSSGTVVGADPVDVTVIDVEDDSCRPRKAPRRDAAASCAPVVSDVDTAVADCIMEVNSARNEFTATWPKEIMSRMLVCKMMASGINILKAGDVVELEASSQKHAWKPSERKRGRPSGPGASSNSQQLPLIVRFSRKGRELGRLPVQFARLLAPALSSGFLEARARVIEAPAISRVLSEVILDVSVYIRKCSFQDCGYEPEAARLRPVGKGDKCGSASVEENGMDFDRLAVVNFISSLGVCEPKSQSNSHVNFDSSENDGVVAEGKAEMYFDTVQKIEHGMVEFVEPAPLRCTLRDYQKIGVSWMLAREKHGSSHHGLNDVMLHPLWKRKAFPDGQVFYANGTTGGLSLTAPMAATGGPFGGILADEMGLGKTIECIALIVSDHSTLCSKARKDSKPSMNGNCRNEETVDVDSVAEDVDRNRGTLIDSKGPAENCASDVEEPCVGCSTEQAPRSQHDVDGKLMLRNRCVDKTEDRATKAVDFRGTRSSRDVIATDSSGDRLDGIRKSGDEQAEEDDQSCRDHVARNSPYDSHGSKSSSDDSEDDFIPSPARNRSKLEARYPSRTRNGSSKRRRPTADESALKGTSQGLLSAVAAKRSESYTGGTLLVVPMSMIQQWLDELSEHVDTDFLRFKAYYGQQRGSARSISVLEADVVVTSYGTLAAEAPDEESEKANKVGGGSIFQLHWRRVVLDEAHTIKSRSTKWAKACFLLNAQHRWCVTGTPIQNHVNDVFSLLHFLQIEPWSSWGFWQRGIVTKMESNDPKLKIEAMSTIRDILSPLTLRRLKSTIGPDGTPLVQLSKRDVQVVRLEQSRIEADFYEALHRKSRAQFDTYVAQGKVLNHYGSVLELLLRLRQACDHPFLIFASSQKDSALMNDRAKLFASFSDAKSLEFVDNVMEDARSGKLSDCPICLDVMDDATAVKSCGHAACRSCLFQVISRRGSAASCPVCRVPIEGKGDLATLPRVDGSRFPMNVKTNWKSSAKLDALVGDVREVEEIRKRANSAVGKTVVMSQFTSFLDLLEIALNRQDVHYLRFDGTLSQKERARVLDSFANDDEMASGTANVMLMSLKSGGVGLNLVSASRLCLADPSWNPQVDHQAMARVHRHGQTRDVVIKRYVIANSVEERLLDVQQRKMDVSEGALSTATEDDKKQARLAEIKLLFS